MTPRSIKHRCPTCGNKKTRTKLFMGGTELYIGNTHCYRCGYHVGTASSKTRTIRTTWSPPKEDEVGEAA